MVIRNHITIFLLSIVCGCFGHPVKNEKSPVLIDMIMEIQNKIEELSQENAELRQHEVFMENEIIKLNEGQQIKLMSEFENHAIFYSVAIFLLHCSKET